MHSGEQISTIDLVTNQLTPRICEELLGGKKRPCCWPGCIHRTDKKPSPWQQAVLIDQKGKERR